VAPEGTPEFFRQLEEERIAREGFVADYARFSAWRGKQVLEVGVGAGSDFVRFARAGAVLTGIDLTQHGVELTRTRLTLEGLSAEVHQADAESLPFADGSFDFVYSWGVVHHTPDPARAIREIVRVARPGGRVCVMIYHRHSLVALQSWALHALLKGRPWRGLRAVIGEHIESVGTQAYTIGEARTLFAELEELEVKPVVTPYDLRVSRSRYLPAWIASLVPKRLGWFLVVSGRKPVVAEAH
jgi:ubiquinone/menaquinone biosynthesis C-methylase UbiE